MNEEVLLFLSGRFKEIRISEQGELGRHVIKLDYEDKRDLKELPTEDNAETLLSILLSVLRSTLSSIMHSLHKGLSKVPN